MREADSSDRRGKTEENVKSTVGENVQLVENSSKNRDARSEIITAWWKRGFS